MHGHGGLGIAALRQTRRNSGVLVGRAMRIVRRVVQHGDQREPLRATSSRISSARV